jgi:hypothetical protein
MQQNTVAQQLFVARRRYGVLEVEAQQNIAAYHGREHNAVPQVL